MKNDYNFNTFTLRFNDNDQESVFRNHYFNITLWQTRSALLLAIILYGLFAALDIWIVPEIKETVWLIRGVVCLAVLMFFGFTYTGLFKSTIQLSLAGIALIVGLGIIVMISLAKDLGSYLYFAGLILVINWTFVFLGLRFINATITCLLIILLYELVAIVINPTPIHILINNSFFMIGASLIAMFAGYIIERRTRESFFKNQVISSRTASIKELMDNTGQGFLSFSSDFLIHPEYSKACKQFFDEPIESKNILEMLFSQNASETEDILNLVFEGVSSFDVLEDILTKEVSLNQRTISIEYRWIEVEKRTENKFMLVLTDVTKEKELKALLDADEEINEMIVKVAVDREGFIQFYGGLEHMFQMLYQSFEQELTKIDTDELFRYYHTIKGGTASYGFKQVAKAAHELESELDGFRKGNSQFSEEFVQELKEKTSNLESILKDSLKQIDMLVSLEDLHKTEEQHYIVPEDKITVLESLLKTPLKMLSFDSLIKAIKNLRKQSIEPVFRKYASEAEQLALKLNKDVQVKLEGLQVEVYKKRFRDFFGVLIHLIRNSIDHGLETPDVRSMLGKPEAGTLSIKALEEDKTVKFIIEDDGAGIDDDNIKNIAVSKALITTEQSLQLSKEEAVKLIFAPGFSTKESVSDISGRGVGMDAVNAVVDDMEGTIQIDTKVGEGTTFTITIPLI